MRCLERLRIIAEKGSYDVRVFLVDAGSTDGTAEKAPKAWDRVTLIRTQSDVYWAEGMALAEKHALDDPDLSDGDFIVWLNDDVLLDEDSLDRAFEYIARASDGMPKIYVGAMRSEAGATTYGGLSRSTWNPLGIRLVAPTAEPVPVDTFHGNFLLVPAPIAVDLQGIDGRFGHHMADIDYGVRSSQRGYKNVLLPGTFGQCEIGGPNFTSRRQQWTFYRSIKGGGHWPTRLHFLEKHSRIPRRAALFAMDVVHALRIIWTPPSKSADHTATSNTEMSTTRD